MARSADRPRARRARPTDAPSRRHTPCTRSPESLESRTRPGVVCSWANERDERARSEDERKCALKKDESRNVCKLQRGEESIADARCIVFIV